MVIGSRQGFRVFAAVWVLAAWVPGPGLAETFVVNSADDSDDGSCDPAPGDCTLREAIDAANASARRDTIEFDAAVFPPGDATSIQPASALPPLSDPAGVGVDGSGAGVVLDGSLLGGGEDGLVIQSGVGQALSKVGVEMLHIRDFPGSGLLVCGGQAPACDDPISKVLVHRVVSTDNGNNGVRVDGGPNIDARVLDSVASRNAGNGISLNAGNDGDLSKALVQNSSASGNAGSGINLNASSGNLGSRVIGCVAEGNSTGVNINAGDSTIGAQVTDTVATGNTNRGINVNAGDDTTGVQIRDAVASGNGGTGVNVNAGEDNTGTRVQGVRSADNGGDGVNLNAGGAVPVRGAQLKDSAAVGNAGAGFNLDGDGNKLSKLIADGNFDGVFLDSEVAGGGNKLSQLRIRGNTDEGIDVRNGSDGNQISKVTAFDNGGGDLSDGNVACADNRWSGNRFGTRNQDCID